MQLRLTLIFCILWPVFSYSQDVLPPIPRCKTGLVVTLPVNGVIEVDASEFDDGSTDNVTLPENLKFYFNGDPSFESYRVDCDTFDKYDVRGEYTTDFFLHVEDEAGNVSACGISLTVQDNKEICGPGYVNCAGCVKSWKSGEVFQAYRNCDTTISKSSCYQIQLDTTRTVFWCNDEDHLNGVSLKDLLIIQRHLLRLEDFEFEEQFVAADVNNNGSVSVADISALRKLILGVADNFDQWGLPSYLIYLETDSFSVNNRQSVLELTRSDSCPSSADFIAIKVGDLDGDADSLVVNHTRQSKKVDIKHYGNGRYGFSINEDMDVSGFELTIELEESDEALSVNSGQLQISQSQFFQKDAKLKIAWNGSEWTNTILACEPLFYLQTKSRPLSATGFFYDPELNGHNVTSSHSNAASVRLYPNILQKGTLPRIEGVGHDGSTWHLTDMKGQVVDQGELQLLDEYVQLRPDLPSGIYLFTCSVSEDVNMLVITD